MWIGPQKSIRAWYEWVSKVNLRLVWMGLKSPIAPGVNGPQKSIHTWCEWASTLKRAGSGDGNAMQELPQSRRYSLRCLFFTTATVYPVRFVIVNSHTTTSQREHAAMRYFLRTRTIQCTISWWNSISVLTKKQPSLLFNTAIPLLSACVKEKYQAQKTTTINSPSCHPFRFWEIKNKRFSHLFLWPS